MIDGLLRRFAEHDYIVKVMEGELPPNAGKDHDYGTLDCAGFAGGVRTAYMQSDQDLDRM